MKKIEAIVRSEKVGEIRKALGNLKFTGLTLTQVDGHGNQRGTVQQWNGREHKINILPKMKIEIVAQDENVKEIVSAIVSSGRTGEIGDGKIFIYPIEEVVRIRTGEKGITAL